MPVPKGTRGKFCDVDITKTKLKVRQERPLSAWAGRVHCGLVQVGGVALEKGILFQLQLNHNQPCQFGTYARVCHGGKGLNCLSVIVGVISDSACRWPLSLWKYGWSSFSGS